MKIGDGSTVWNSLSYANQAAITAALSATFVPLSQTMAGAAAPQAFIYDPVTFLSTVDPIWKIGYNPDRLVTAEPQWYLGIEGNYKIASGAEGWDNTGTHLLNEWYVNYASPDGTTVVNFRPIYVGTLRDSNSSRAAHIFFDVGTDSTTNSQLVIQAGAATPIVTMTSAGLFVASGMALKIGTQQVLTTPVTQSAAYTRAFPGTFATTAVANNQYILQIDVTRTAPITGVCFLNDSAVAGNVITSLYNSAGTRLAQSSSTAQAGTFSVQFVPFTAQYTPATGTYYIAITTSSATSKFSFGNGLGGGVAAQAAGSFIAPATITPPSLTSGGQVPQMSSY